MIPPRTFLFALALFGLLPAPCNAQPVLAYVAAKDANPKRLEVFKKGLAELGLTEGINIRLEYREAVLDGDYGWISSDAMPGNWMRSQTRSKKLLKAVKRAA